MNRPVTFALSLGIVLGSLVAGPARAADDVGAQGRLVQLTINGAGSDDFSTHHGSIFVKASGKKPEVYTWGGTACPASKLSDAQIAALENAFHNRHRTLIRPRYKPGDVKDTRCLVGFELAGG